LCNRRTRDLKRSLTAIAQPFGAAVTIELTGSGHIRAIIVLGDTTLSIVTAATPSDWRSQRNLEAFARRKLRALTERVSP
jgi:hypothetical protein